MAAMVAAGTAGATAATAVMAEMVRMAAAMSTALAVTEAAIITVPPPAAALTMAKAKSTLLSAKAKYVTTVSGTVSLWLRLPSIEREKSPMSIVTRSKARKIADPRTVMTNCRVAVQIRRETRT
jgi:hypothetical protein